VGSLVYDSANDFETESNALWYGAELRTLTDLSERMPDDVKLDITAGVAAEFADTDSASIQFESDGTQVMPVDIETSFNIAGIYAEINTEVASKVAATAGVRYDRNSLFDNNLSPRAALFYKHSESYGGKLLYAEGFRNPSIFEAFYEDGLRFRPGCAPQCENIGSTVFPELITSYEVVGWGKPLPGVKVRASLWRWEVENLIEKRRILDPMSLTERLQFQNLAELTSQGAEVEASYRDTRGWYGFGSISLNDVHRDGEEAFNSPTVMVKMGVSSPRWFDRVHLSTDVNFIGARPTRDSGTDADPWLGWNAVAYVPDYHGFDFTLGVRNILGLRADIPAQSDYDRQSPEIDVFVIPGPGREIFARVGYQY
jgi:outer membrane receptor protein involved in Fe transport